MFDNRESRKKPPESIEASCGIRLAELDQTLFLAVLEVYNQVVKAGLSEDDLREEVERELFDRTQSLRKGASSAEWRLGSKFSRQSKLKLSTVFERHGDRENPVIYFWFNPNTTGGVENASQVESKNEFQQAVDGLLKETNSPVELKATDSGIELL